MYQHFHISLNPSLCHDNMIIRLSYNISMIKPHHSTIHYSPGLPRSMPNADQCRSVPIKIMALIRNVSQCQSLPIIADQCRSIPLNSSQFREELIGIDRNWSTLGSMPEFWLALIGIGHWSRESCTLLIGSISNAYSISVPLPSKEAFLDSGGSRPQTLESGISIGILNGKSVFQGPDLPESQKCFLGCFSSTTLQSSLYYHCMRV